METTISLQINKLYVRCLLDIELVPCEVYKREAGALPASASLSQQDVGGPCCLGAKHIPGEICQQPEHRSALHRPSER